MNYIQVNGGWIIQWESCGQLFYEGHDGYIARDPGNATPFPFKPAEEQILSMTGDQDGR